MQIILCLLTKFIKMAKKIILCLKLFYLDDIIDEWRIEDYVCTLIDL